MSIVYTCIKGCQVIVFKQKYCIISSDDLFTFTISEDFEKMWHNIRVNTVRVPVMGFPNYKELNVNLLSYLFSDTCKVTCNSRSYPSLSYLILVSLHVLMI